MTRQLAKKITQDIELARETIEANYDDIHEPEFDLGYLFCLQSICDEFYSENSLFDFVRFVRTHCDFVFSLEKGIVENNNNNSQDMRKWAQPIARRIADEMPSIENDSEEKDKIIAALQKLLFHNPSFAEAFIGTNIIEESYFDELS